MAALGGKGVGLFTQSAEDVDSDFSGNVSSPNSSESTVNVLMFTRFDKQTGVPADKKQIPSYQYTMEVMSPECYLPEWMKGATSQVGLPPMSETLPIYDVSNPPETNRKSMLRREKDDTFRPPHGPPISSIISLGYGKEVDLEPHQQAVWCTDKKLYYFIDHVKKSTFIKDLQSPPAPRYVVTRREITCKHSAIAEIPSPNLTNNSLCVSLAGERALRKPHGLTINASGADGKHGTRGQKGNNGIKGATEYFCGDEHDGRSGSNGEQGTDGQAGTDGSNGRNLTVNLVGDSLSLHVSIPGCCSETVSLGGETCEEVILVNCQGGDGGDGGNGGEGGGGGDGEDGMKGNRQRDGGHGGDGGEGGQGGKGGRGGNAGSGGQCVIQTTDPRLLMLIEADCRAGRAGEGGQGGRGGEGGRRGFGGEGETWEDPDSPRSGAVKVIGLQGKPGMAGTSGTDGAPGSIGSAGEDGAILWVVKGTSGEVLCSSNTRYNAEVTSIEVSSAHDNETFEPNQKLSISNVTVVNSGGLPLPAGAVLSFPSTNTVIFEPMTFVLPEIAVKETFVVPMIFHGRVVDQASPNSPGPLCAEAKFSSRIELLGRLFEKSVLEHKLTVAYPLKISFALSQRTVSRSEITFLEIGIENTSNQTYGCSDDTKGSAWVQVHMDSRLIPLGVRASRELTDTQSQVTEETLSYHVTFDPKTPDSMYVKIKEMNPGEVLSIPIAVQMESYAELYDTCIWQADLWLQGKMIEYKIQEICVSPAYSPPSSPTQLGDVLMIKNDKIKQDEFHFWRRIFKLLGVSVDYWDAGYKTVREDSSIQQDQPESSNQTTSSENVSQQQESSDQSTSSSPTHRLRLQQLIYDQMYSGKLVLYPHCTLEDVPADLILSHFHDPAHQQERSTDLNSSMLLFLDPFFPESLEFYTYQYKGHSLLLSHLCSSEKYLQLPKEAYTGHHLIAPGTIVPPDRSSKHAAKATMKKLEKEIPSQAVALTNSTSNIQQSGLFRYSYGAMHVRRCPLLRSCNFQCVDGASGNLTSMGADDPLFTVSSQAVPLGSRFGQVFLAVMTGIPLHCKLSVLKKTEDKNSPDYIEFYLPNGVKLTKGDLAAICIAHEVADEVYSCTGEAHRMTYIKSELDLSKALLRNGKSELVSSMMDLIKREVVERRKNLNTPTIVQASNEIIELCNSWTATRTHQPSSLSQTSNCRGTVNACTSSTVSSMKLPPLRILHDTSRVLRSHQHFVDEDKYNISQLL